MGTILKLSFQSFDAVIAYWAGKQVKGSKQAKLPINEPVVEMIFELPDTYGTPGKAI